MAFSNYVDLSFYSFPESYTLLSCQRKGTKNKYHGYGFVEIGSQLREDKGGITLLFHGCYGLNGVPAPPSHAHVLALNTSECDRVGR